MSCSEIVERLEKLLDGRDGPLARDLTCLLKDYRRMKYDQFPITPASPDYATVVSNLAEMCAEANRRIGELESELDREIQTNKEFCRVMQIMANVMTTEQLNEVDRRKASKHPVPHWAWVNPPELIKPSKKEEEKP